MVQPFLPDVALGDKRIVMIDGEVTGAINRRPGEGEFRSNLAVGGSAEPTELTAREREICAAMGPRLKQLGLIFVGIDVIGGQYLTERLYLEKVKQEQDRLKEEEARRTASSAKVFIDPATHKPTPLQSTQINQSGVSTAGKGLTAGILYMLLTPYLLVGGLAFWWFKNRKKIIE
jgi:hypothetical protein